MMAEVQSWLGSCSDLFPPFFWDCILQHIRAKAVPADCMPLSAPSISAIISAIYQRHYLRHHLRHLSLMSLAPPHISHHGPFGLIASWMVSPVPSKLLLLFSTDQ